MANMIFFTDIYSWGVCESSLFLNTIQVKEFQGFKKIDKMGIRVSGISKASVISDLKVEAQRFKKPWGVPLRGELPIWLRD